MKRDPLTCELWDLLQDVDSRTECDCKAPPEAHHRETCAVTPIYAEIVRDGGSWRDAANDLSLEFRDFVQLDGRLSTMIQRTPLWMA